MILKPFFNFGDSPNLPATSKKAALSSRARAFCQPARAGLALLQKSAIFGRGPNLQQSRGYPEKAGFTGEGVTPAERRDDKNMRCPGVCPIKKAAKKDAKES